MYPDLISIGPFTIHTYGVFVALGFLGGILISVRIGKSMGITMQQVIDMGFFIIVWGIIGSRLAYIFINFSYYKSHLLDALKIWEGGLVFSGGLIAVAISSLYYAGKMNLSIWAVGDLWSPAASIGQAIGRIGCFMAGCCYGKETDFILGVTFSHPNSLAPKNIPIHPTQIYSSLSGLIIFIILIILTGKKKFEGQILLWFLILHSTSRLLIERFRGDERGLIPGTDWSITQMTAILILFVSVSLLFILKSLHEKKLDSK